MNENTCKKIGFVVETLCRQFPEDGDQTGRRSTTRHCKPSLHTIAMRVAVADYLFPSRRRLDLRFKNNC